MQPKTMAKTALIAIAAVGVVSRVPQLRGLVLNQ